MHQKDTQFADWMDWFRGERYGQSDPFRVPDGRRCTTDGVMAMVAAHDGPTVDNTKYVERGKFIGNYLASSPKNERDLSRDFMEQFGPCVHPDFDECENCKGSGESRHVCDCDFCDETKEECGECDGKGKEVYDPDKRPVRLWGMAFDANLIAYMVEHAPAADAYRLRLLDGVLLISTDLWDGLIVKLSLGGDNAVDVMEPMASIESA
jgi:hypothetical protein